MCLLTLFCAHLECLFGVVEDSGSISFPAILIVQRSIQMFKEKRLLLATCVVLCYVEESSVFVLRPFGMPGWSGGSVSFPHVRTLLTFERSI